MNIEKQQTKRELHNKLKKEGLCIRCGGFNNRQPKVLCSNCYVIDQRKRYKNRRRKYEKELETLSIEEQLTPDVKCEMVERRVRTVKIENMSGMESLAQLLPKSFFTTKYYIKKRGKGKQ